MKTCPKCHDTKVESKFEAHRNICRECRNAYNRQYHHTRRKHRVSLTASHTLREWGFPRGINMAERICCGE
jgi:transposase-like protein